MQQPSKSYLDSKVLTASQPRLQLMLLEGAVRFGTQAQKMWHDGVEFASVDRQLARVAEILEELTHGAAAGESELSKAIESQYAAIYRELASCRINEEVEKLESCLELLQYHRETWKLVCEQLESKAEPKQSQVSPFVPFESFTGESFSLEA